MKKPSVLTLCSNAMLVVVFSRGKQVSKDSTLWLLDVRLVPKLAKVTTHDNIISDDMNDTVIVNV